MNGENTLRKELLDRLTDYRETAPVFRVQQRRVDELEAAAEAFAQRFATASWGSEVRLHLRRLRESTTIYLPNEAQARVFHPSGVMLVKQSIGPVEQLITDTTDKETLTTHVMDAARRLEFDRYQGRGESLQFERLWQIKATGMTQTGERGAVALCRVVGAFRRYLYELPVWGRASAFIELAGDDVIASTGVDWRPCSDEPVDHAKLMDPDAAANQIITELSAGVPGGIASSKDYAPEMFALGYFSLPKRQEQAFMQPVYVAMFRAQGDTTLNRLIVIPAAVTSYETMRRVVKSPPKDAIKPQPSVRNAGFGAMRHQEGQ